MSVSRLTEEQTQKFAEAARLKLTDAETKQYTEQLGKWIEYAENLNELPLEGVEPAASVSSVKNALREDKVKPWIERDEALQNVPEHKDGLIKVPAILE